MTCKSKNVRAGDRFLHRGAVHVAVRPCTSCRNPCKFWFLRNESTSTELTELPTLGVGYYYFERL